jgi:Ca2+-binding EF-hand superfamily protein
MEMQNFKSAKIKVETMMIRIRDRAAMRLREEEKTMKRIAVCLDKRGWTIEEAFKFYDTDMSGFITTDELRLMFEKMKIEVN